MSTLTIRPCLPGCRYDHRREGDSQLCEVETGRLHGAGETWSGTHLTIGASRLTMPDGTAETRVTLQIGGHEWIDLPPGSADALVAAVRAAQRLALATA